MYESSVVLIVYKSGLTEDFHAITNIFTSANCEFRAAIGSRRILQAMTLESHNKLKQICAEANMRAASECVW